MATVKLGEVIVAGNDYTFTITVQKDGAIYDITGATLTCSIRAKGKSTNAISDHAMSITDAVNGVATLTLLDTESTDLEKPDAIDPEQTIQHFGDVKVVESGGNILHCGPFEFPVRRAIT